MAKRSSSTEVVPESDNVDFNALLLSDEELIVDKELEEKYADKEGISLRHMKKNDLITLPQILLLQSNSTPVQEGRGQAGSFWNTDKEQVMKPPITFAPVFSFMSRYRWPDIETNISYPICFSANAKEGVGNPGGNCFECPNKKHWEQGSQKPIGDCDETYSFIIYTIEQESFLLLNLSRTKARLGRQLTRLINRSGELPFMRAYLLSAKFDDSGPNKYWITTFENFSSNNQPFKKLSDPKFVPLIEKLEKAHKEIGQLYDKGQLLPSFSNEPEKIMPAAEEELQINTVEIEEEVSKNSEDPF